MQWHWWFTLMSVLMLPCIIVWSSSTTPCIIVWSSSTFSSARLSVPVQANCQLVKLRTERPIMVQSEVVDIIVMSFCSRIARASSVRFPDHGKLFVKQTRTSTVRFSLAVRNYSRKIASFNSSFLTPDIDRNMRRFFDALEFPPIGSWSCKIRFSN